MNEPIKTSLSHMDNHDWNVISNTWASGIDWCVGKLGRKWVITLPIGNFPLFKTKTAAYDAATKLILLESRHRAWKRDKAEGRE